jgi:hypothetical protein
MTFSRKREAGRCIVRRRERATPGELIRMGVKKLERTLPGGNGEDPGRVKRRAGRYDLFHPLVDDYSRLAYSEVLPDETDLIRAAFCARPHAFLVARGVFVQSAGLTTRSLRSEPCCFDLLSRASALRT